MSYLSSLVTAPAAAAVARPMSANAAPTARGIGLPLEQAVEVVASAQTSAAPAPDAAQATVPERRVTHADGATSSADVEDALRAAFNWVSAPRAGEALPPLPDTPATDRKAARLGSTSLEVDTERLTAPMPNRRTVQATTAPHPAAGDRSEPAIAAHALPPPLDRDDIMARASSANAHAHATTDANPGERASAQAAMREAQAARDRPPHRSTVSAAAWHQPARDAAAADRQAAARPSSIQVRIGSIDLHVRTPPLPTPTAQAAALAAPAAAETPPRAPSPGFAFSARRHHLRWG